VNSRFEQGISRRRFARRIVGVSSVAVPALSLGRQLAACADDLARNRKSAILLWMGGGPSTIDIWDLKPEMPTGGPFKPIGTSGDVQICEHLPNLAKQMHHLAVVRSMSTREENHDRARYYMHTGYAPSDVTQHPSYGAVVARELIGQRPGLQIPPFVAVGGGSVGAGYLGKKWAPLSVRPDGKIKGLSLDEKRLAGRLAALELLEKSFADQDRDVPRSEHVTVVKNSLKMLRSEQVKAFDIIQEPLKSLKRYGLTDFGKGCVMARRLVEAGVPFVEVALHGWDNHTSIFPTLKDVLLPEMDRAMAALIEDLHERRLLENTLVIWLGEFGRTPRINDRGGRDHYARAWSAVLGGCGIRGGIAVGRTSKDGTRIETEPHTSQDLMATVIAALGISLDTIYKSRSGRELKIANDGKAIGGLLDAQ